MQRWLRTHNSKHSHRITIKNEKKEGGEGRGRGGGGGGSGRDWEGYLRKTGRPSVAHHRAGSQVFSRAAFSVDPVKSRLNSCSVHCAILARNLSYIPLRTSISVQRLCGVYHLSENQTMCEA